MSDRVVKKEASHHHLIVPEIHQYNEGVNAEQRDLRKTLDLPVLKSSYANLFLVLNIILPGIGTILSAFTPFHINHPDHRSSKPLQVFIGLLQLLTAVFIVGWICSIVWGCMLRSVAIKYEPYDREDTLYHILEDPAPGDEEEGEDGKGNQIYKSSPYV